MGAAMKMGELAATTMPNTNRDGEASIALPPQIAVGSIARRAVDRCVQAARQRLVDMRAITSRRTICLESRMFSCIRS
jgi:hypothetical protein